MSYCVNCGVELEKTERLCPLCFERVENPLEKSEIRDASDTTPNYPRVPVAGMKTNFRDLVIPITLILGIPVLISLICDYLTTGDLTWSKFVAISIGLIYIYLVPPLAMHRRWLGLCIFLDAAGTVFFLYTLNIFTNGEWFFPRALPVSLIMGGILLIVGCLFNYLEIRKLVRFSIALFSVAASALCLDYFTRSAQSRLIVGWSLYVAVPCVLIAAAALVVNRNQRLKEQMRQRFFV